MNTKASYNLRDIRHETANHWVLETPHQMVVYRTTITHSVRVATIGYTGERGLAKAVAECARREALIAGGAR